MEDYNAGAVRVVGGIEVPPTDKRGWRTLVLPNGMRVVLISDPVCDMAAASLAVGVGSLHDPIQGDTRLHGVSKPARSRVGHAAAAARSALTANACPTRPHAAKHILQLSHFLEHLLFMGSKAFPSENEYSEFISQGECGDTANESSDA